MRSVNRPKPVLTGIRPMRAGAGTEPSAAHAPGDVRSSIPGGAAGRVCGSDLRVEPRLVAGPAAGGPLRVGFHPLGDLRLRTHEALHRRQVLGRIDQADVLASGGIGDQAE